MGSRFVRPETRTLTLGNGDTLIVKKRLNYGEQRAMFGRMYLAGVDGTMKTNPLGLAISAVLAYLLDWSLADDDGRKVQIAGQPIDAVLAALDNLAPDDFSEIHAAIEAHVTAMAAERAAEKNGHGGETLSAAISPSPSAAAGASSGSVSSTSTTMRS